MNLLLDTHVALWAVLDPERLSAVARERILDGSIDVAVSAASVWEIAIKHRLRRGHPDDMPFSGSEAADAFRSAGYLLLPITAAHSAAVDGLPPIHADPFDRMLVAQARTEPMQLLTADTRLEAYGWPVLRV